MVVHEQYIHCRVTDYLTVVYAKTESQKREELWRDLFQIGNGIQEAWLLCGDFNSVLTSGDRIDSPILPGETQVFQNCIDSLQLTTLRHTGRYFTFCNRHQDGSRVYSKIDWASGNFKWTVDYGHVEAEFLNPGIPDHSPILIQVNSRPPTTRPKPFRLFKTVLEHSEFAGILMNTWKERH